MKWKPFGKYSNSCIESYRRGCASRPCVHIEISMAITTDEAKKFIKSIQRAIEYAENKGK
jgi:hypothetical protein